MSAGIIPVKVCEGHDKGGTAAVEAHSRVSYPLSGDRWPRCFLKASEEKRRRCFYRQRAGLNAGSSSHKGPILSRKLCLFFSPPCRSVWGGEQDAEGDTQVSGLLPLRRKGLSIHFHPSPHFWQGSLPAHGRAHPGPLPCHHAHCHSHPRSLPLAWWLCLPQRFAPPRPTGPAVPSLAGHLPWQSFAFSEYF